jgi:hypothetical protein
MAFKEKTCAHLSDFDYKAPDKDVCEECVKIDADWVHLRKCQTCGTTLCCDSSVHQHARKHNESTGHPVIISAEKGEDWAWCYVDEIYAKGPFTK